METSSILNEHIIQLYSIIFGCLKEANEELGKVVHNKQLIHIFTKEHNQRFTQYDYCIQRMFEVALRTYFNSSLNIIGEENTKQEIDKEYDLKLEFNKEKWKQSTIGLSVINQLKSLVLIDQKETISINDLTFYIDPLDATNQFIKGNFDPVTVLIGICYKHIPLIGFIHYPMKTNHIITYFNIPSKGVFTFDFNTGKINQFKPELKPIDQWDFVISSSRAEEQMFQAIELFKDSSIVQVGGLGNKVVEVIKKDCFYLSTNGKSSLWDVCAGDCIGRELNPNYCGFFYLNGTRIDYSSANTELSSTVIYTIHDKRAESFISTIKENKLYKANITS